MEESGRHLLHVLEVWVSILSALLCSPPRQLPPSSCPLRAVQQRSLYVPSIITQRDRDETTWTGAERTMCFLE